MTTISDLTDVEKGPNPPGAPAVEDLWIDTDDPIVADATEVSAPAYGSLTGSTVGAQLVQVEDGKAPVGHGHANPGIIVQDENVNVQLAATTLDFQGAGVTVASAPGGEAVVTIPGGGGGGPGTMPGAKAIRTTNQTAIVSGVQTPVLFEAESRDTDGFLDLAAQPTRFTCPAGQDGTYAFRAGVGWASGATGKRTILFRKTAAGGGTTTIFGGADINAPTTGGMRHQANGEIALVAGDYVEVLVVHTQGANMSLDVASFGEAGAWFSGWRIG